MKNWGCARGWHTYLPVFPTTPKDRCCWNCRNWVLERWVSNSPEWGFKSTCLTPRATLFMTWIPNWSLLLAFMERTKCPKRDVGRLMLFLVGVRAVQFIIKSDLLGEISSSVYSHVQRETDFSTNPKHHCHCKRSRKKRRDRSESSPKQLSSSALPKEKGE